MPSDIEPGGVFPDRDRFGSKVIARVGRDVASGQDSGEVNRTPTLFVDGVVYRGAYGSRALLEALAR